MRFANKLDLAPPVAAMATNAPAATNAAAPEVAGNVVVAGGPAVLGQLVINGPIMANGQVMFAASGRMRPATKAAPEPAAPLMVYPPGSTRCFFNEQEAVTLKLDKIADDGVTGAAVGIGALKLPLGALIRLEFNPGAKRTQADTDDDEL